MITLNVVHKKLLMFLVTYITLDDTECITQCQNVLKI